MGRPVGLAGRGQVQEGTSRRFAPGESVVVK